MIGRIARTPVVVAVALFVFVGCNPGTTATGSPSASAGQPTQEASATPASTPGATATGSAGASDLESAIPDSIGGLTLEKRTVLGTGLGELSPTERDQFLEILEEVEGPLEGFAAVSGTAEGVAMSAMRMEGTAGGQLGDAFIGLIMRATDGGATVEDVTVGGKAVKRVTPPNTTPILVYVAGEVMFIVQADDPAHAEEALAGMP